MLSDRQTFAGKNWAFTLCSYLFVRSTHGRDILLDPNRLKSQTFFLKSQDPKEQEFNNFTKRNHFLFQEE